MFDVADGQNIVRENDKKRPVSQKSGGRLEPGILTLLVHQAGWISRFYI
jgi:hypothetical protein